MFCIEVIYLGFLNSIFCASNLVGEINRAFHGTLESLPKGYVQNGFMDEARHLFSKMISSGVRPNSITFVSLLPSVFESESFMQRM
ncbi:Pentatricopeptide repeat (PPR) superfamily protein [Euphorbia peplus]|nr:Pentatricopeptide repeat (PPR) superfamily protein [Euphorbia peplus]